MFGRKKSSGAGAESVKVPRSAWMTCMFLSGSVLLVLFLHTSLSPALPLFVREFEVSYTLASWVLTAYMISGAVMTIIIGRLADIFGARKMLIIELGCFAVGTALAGFAQDFYSLLIIRALQGVAVANTPLALKMVREHFPKEKFSIGASIITASYSGGMVVGLILGAQIVGELGWRYVFFISTPITIAMLFIGWRYIDRKPKVIPKVQQQPSKDTQTEPTASRKKGIDVRGAIALAVSLTTFLLAITFAGSLPEMLAEFLVFLVIGMASLVVFFYIEEHTEYPLVNLKIMFSKLMIAGNMIFLLAGILEYLIFQTTPTLATAPPPSGFGMPLSASGLIQLPYTAMIIIFGLGAGLYIARKGPLRLLLPGLVIGVVSVALLTAFHSTFLGTMMSLMILGIGFTLMITAANYTMITSNPMEYTGLVSSTTTDLRVIGGSIGPVIAGIFMSLFVVTYEVGGQVQSYPSPLSFNLIFTIALIVVLVQAALVVVFRRRAARIVESQHRGDVAAA